MASRVRSGILGTVASVLILFHVSLAETAPELSWMGEDEVLLMPDLGELSTGLGADGAVYPGSPWDPASLASSVHATEEHAPQRSNRLQPVLRAASRLMEGVTTMRRRELHRMNDNSARAPARQRFSPRRTVAELSIKLGVGPQQQQVSAGAANPVPDFEPCDSELRDYTPCEDPTRSNSFPHHGMFHRERHCPLPSDPPLRCLIPPPAGYKFPLPWPQSRDEAWYVNVPYKHLTEAKADQHWMEYNADTEKFSFPGGGTTFRDGADKYIERLGALIPLNDTDGTVRTALDTGCGVGSFGAFMLSRNVQTLSMAPRDGHVAQVQFALERGLPAMLGVLSTKRLAFPSRSFDLVHCSRCLIPWAIDGGKLLAEVDRVLRPGGFWVLTGPPIDWERLHKGWGRSKESLKAEEDSIKAAAAGLCWELFKKEGIYAVWRKPMGFNECLRKKAEQQPGEEGGQPPLCAADQDPDFAWYTNMSTCISRQPEVAPETTQGEDGAPKLTYLAPWPERLWSVPPRVASGSVPGLTAEILRKDSEEWKARVQQYKTKWLPELAAGGDKGIKYRNILDMNAGAGGFAAALFEEPVWVMSMVPVEGGAVLGEQGSKEDGGAQMKLATGLLGTIFERGLLGTYQDWCEAFSTYPRTYDLIHVANLFGNWHLRRNPCPIESVLLEMDRMLRPEGAALIQDDEAVLWKILPLAKAMRWDARIEGLDSAKDSVIIAPAKGDVLGRGQTDDGGESSAAESRLVLVCIKKYWVEG